MIGGASCGRRRYFFKGAFAKLLAAVAHPNEWWLLARAAGFGAIDWFASGSGFPLLRYRAQLVHRHKHSLLRRCRSGEGLVPFLLRLW